MTIVTRPSDMKTSQFEAIKIAIKQDKEGYVLTLRMHPEDVPEEILRDFVGARYQVVMVRLNQHEQPLDREEAFSGERAVKVAGLLCRDPQFWQFLHEEGLIIDPSEQEATDWLRRDIGVKSRTELKTNDQARQRLDEIHREFLTWQQRE